MQNLTASVGKSVSVSDILEEAQVRNPGMYPAEPKGIMLWKDGTADVLFDYGLKQNPKKDLPSEYIPVWYLRSENDYAE